MFTMKSIFFITLCLLSMTANSEEIETCEGFPEVKPSISIVTEYNINHLLSITEIHSKFVKKWSGSTFDKKWGGGDFYRVIAYTDSVLGINYYYPVKVYKTNKGFCSIITPEIEIGITPTVIYISSELNENSCSYNETLEHEMKHVEFIFSRYKLIQQEFEKSIKNKVHGYVYVEGDESTLETYLNANIDSLDKELYSIAEKASQTSDGVDTPEEYTRLFNTCKTENTKLVEILDEYKNKNK